MELYSKSISLRLNTQSGWLADRRDMLVKAYDTGMAGDEFTAKTFFVMLERNSVKCSRAVHDLSQISTCGSGVDHSAVAIS